MIALLDLVVLMLAVNQIVEVWHHGEIFAGARSRIENWPILDDEEFSRLRRLSRWNYRVWEFFQTLLLCPYCVSVWAGWFVVAAWLSGLWWLWAVVLGLAVARLANLLNDLIKRLRPPEKGQQ